LLLRVPITHLFADASFRGRRILESSDTITEIRLGSNNIGDEGAKALATVLESNDTNTSIYLRNNDIGVEGKKAVDVALAATKIK